MQYVLHEKVHNSLRIQGFKLIFKTFALVVVIPRYGTIELYHGSTVYTSVTVNVGQLSIVGLGEGGTGGREPILRI